MAKRIRRANSNVGEANLVWMSLCTMCSWSLASPLSPPSVEPCPVSTVALQSVTELLIGGKKPTFANIFKIEQAFYSKKMF